MIRNSLSLFYLGTNIFVVRNACFLFNKFKIITLRPVIIAYEHYQNILQRNKTQVLTCQIESYIIVYFTIFSPRFQF